METDATPANTSIYVVPNLTAGSNTVTVTFSGDNGSGINVVEYSNVPASPYDAGASAVGPPANPVTGNFTTTSANDMLYTICYQSHPITLSVGTTQTTPTWTALTTAGVAPSGTGVTVLAEDGAAGAAGSYYGQCVETGGTYAVIMSAVALKGLASTTVATPTFSPGTATYTSTQTVTISDTTAGATIYYTTDGSTPTTASALHGSAGLTVTVSATETLNAIGVLTGDSNSAVGDAEYIINLPQAATPGFSPLAGSFTTVQTVTISDSTASSTIYYTTNGTVPTTASTSHGAAPLSVSVSATQTLEAIAIATNYSSSAVQSGVYTINLPAATPGFSPGAGSYSTVQTVTITDTTAGATIYYTTNGVAPSTSSPVYSGPVTVPAPETLEAVAIASGYSLSTVGSAAYTFPLPSSGPSEVQQCSQYTGGSGYDTVASCTLPGAVTAGDTLVIGVWTGDPLFTDLTVTSSTTAQPVSVTALQDYEGASGNGNGYMSAYYLPNAPAGSITITAKEIGYYDSDFVSVIE
jgi:hypothetical protein